MSYLYLINWFKTQYDVLDNIIKLSLLDFVVLIHHLVWEVVIETVHGPLSFILFLVLIVMEDHQEIKVGDIICGTIQTPMLRFTWFIDSEFYMASQSKNIFLFNNTTL